MLAKRVPTILPELTAIESIETTRIYSAMGLMKPGQPLLATRPHSSPHHTISNAGLVGRGKDRKERFSRARILAGRSSDSTAWLDRAAGRKMHGMAMNVVSGRHTKWRFTWIDT